MITREVETVERRAPYLADIPVLGHLFRFDTSDERRAEMIIILTPRVIRNPSDAERIKQAEFARISWCAADVYEVYGDIGMDFHTRMAAPEEGAGTEVIYPDLNPRGETDQQPTPTPMPMPRPEGTPGQQPFAPGDPDQVPPPPLPPFPEQGRRGDAPPWTQWGPAWGSSPMNSPVGRQPLPLSRNAAAPIPTAAHPMTGNTAAPPQGLQPAYWGTLPNANTGTSTR